MKHSKFLRTTIAIAMMLIGWLPSLAHDFEVDGIFYNKTSDNTVAVTYKGSYSSTYVGEYVGDVVIPSSVNYEGITYSVTSIGESAFSGCLSLTSIQIPNSVTSIGSNAFWGCSKLTSVVIPNSVTSIGDETFGHCDNLTSIQIPNSVTSVGDGAFYYCKNLTSIVVDSGNTIYDSRNGCNAIIETASNTLIAGCKNTIIPNSVTSIGEKAFYFCFSLTIIEIPNSVTSIGDLAFWYCSSLTSIKIPNSVTSIGKNAFSSCKSLTSIVVDAGNTKYDSRNDCNAIIETASNTLILGCKNSKIPNSVTSIGEKAFYYCSSLTSIEIPNSVKGIGSMAFYDCENLISIEIPNSVTFISNYAFTGCDNLTKITCLATTPPRIGSGTFTNYSADLYVPAGCKESYEAAEYWNKYTNIIELEPELEEGATFEYEGLTYKVVVKGEELAVIASKSGKYSGVVVIPSSVNYNGATYSVTSIGNGAFFYCYSLTTVVIPNSVTSIGEQVFYGCESLTNVKIPNSVTSIGIQAFYGCSKLTSIEIPNSVTSIGNSAFNGCSKLASIEIPNSVTSIGNSAFNGCSKLASIEIPNSVTSIGDSAFKNCYGLTSIVIGNSVTNIGSEAFGSCYSLTSIEIPNSVTSIGLFAFSSCSNLTSIIVEAGNTNYDSREECNAIIGTTNNNLIVGCKNSKITHSVRSISYGAFYGCTGLTSIEIPNSVTSIGERAFDHCSNLTSIVIGNSVTSIGNKTFNGCTSLTEITCLAITPPTIKSGTFSNYNADLYVPAGCKVEYESVEYWKNFTNIIELPTLATSITLDNTEVELEATETATLVATVLPELTTNKSVTWTSSNEAVATVDANGVVTAIAVGESVITATTTDGSNLSATCKVTVVPTLAETITLDKTEISLEATETATLVATVLPELTTNKSVTWTSSNEAVAIVDANGVVIAIALGEAVITATTTDGSNLSTTCKVAVVPTLATSIELDKTEISLEATETATLVATVLPELTTNKSVTWTSSNEAVATVDANGVVTAIALGEANITATTTDGSNLSATCNVTVVPTLATSIELDKTEISLEATETATLVATVLPETTSNKSVEWKSSNDAVATVNNNGEVTAIAVGEAIITAITTDGTNLSASCQVTVVPTMAETITLDKTEISLEATETATLVATVLPELTTNKSVAWTSSNEAVATVDANGVVTAIAVGESVITATTTDGSNLSASCKVTVVPTLAESITLDKTEISLEATETATLVASVLPELTTNKSVTWTSSNEAVATVDANGVVTAIALGESVITATTADGSNLSATCKVTVVPTLATSIELDKTEISLEATETATLVATVLPETTSNKSVEWKSSNDAVAIVNKNGEVTAIAVGEAVITATTADGTNLSASCQVTVVPTLVVSIEVTPNSVEAEENSEVQLSVNILPENATYKSVEWSSSNDAIASVNANGLVKIRKEGNVVITATTTDGSNLSATCSINVYSGIDGVNGNEVIVATIGDNIVVKNAKLGSVVNVYSSNGALIKSMTATDGSVVIEAPIKGIYVITIDGKSFKVMVK